MPTKEQLLEILPVRDEIVLVVDPQSTTDIEQLILSKHEEYAADYDLISHYFDTGNIIDTSRGIFEFLKAYVPYTKESGKYQTVKSPARILLVDDGSNPFDRVDCKNYASFIAGIIDSIQRKNPDNWDWAYRFASYDAANPEPGHVFVVVTIDGKELWIDPVFTSFNSGDLHEWELDRKPAIGGLYSISGPGDFPTGTVSVNSDVAWVSFLQWVQWNLFGMRDLLTRYPQVTTTTLKQFCAQNNFDYGQLMNFIQYGKI